MKQSSQPVGLNAQGERSHLEQIVNRPVQQPIYPGIALLPRARGKDDGGHGLDTSVVMVRECLEELRAVHARH